MTKQEVLDYLDNVLHPIVSPDNWNVYSELHDMVEELPSAEPRWIPCGDRLPENMEPVNVTWVNREPEPYYMNIKDKPFTATGIYFRGKWYWYSVTCKDMLGEYGENEFDEVADGIDIVAWMPLPKPYEVEDETVN